MSEAALHAQARYWREQAEARDAEITRLRGQVANLQSLCDNIEGDRDRLRAAVEARDKRRFNEHGECHWCGCDSHKRCAFQCLTLTHPLEPSENPGELPDGQGGEG